MLSVHTGKLSTLVNQLQSCIYTQNQLSTFIFRFSSLQNPIQRMALRNLQQAHDELQTALQKTAVYFQNAQTQYETVEHTLESYAKAFSEHPSAENIIPVVSSFHTLKEEQPFGYVKKKDNTFTHRFHTSIQKNKNLFSYLHNGICAGVFAGYEVTSINAGFNKKYAQGDVGLAAGKVSVSADAKALLFQNKKFNPALELRAEAEAAIAQGNATLRIGNEYLSAQGDVSLGIGVVSASAQAVINKNEFTCKGEVGAAAVKGEAKGTLSIFGIKITATATGELGAVGASAEFSSKKGEFTFGSKISLLAGLGFKIKVNY